MDQSNSTGEFIDTEWASLEINNKTFNYELKTIKYLSYRGKSPNPNYIKISFVIIWCPLKSNFKKINNKNLLYHGTKAIKT